MELLIKQRVFSWTDSYDVYDESGRAKYFGRQSFSVWDTRFIFTAKQRVKDWEL